MRTRRHAPNDTNYHYYYYYYYDDYNDYVYVYIYLHLKTYIYIYSSVCARCCMHATPQAGVPESSVRKMEGDGYTTPKGWSADFVIRLLESVEFFYLAFMEDRYM